MKVQKVHVTSYRSGFNVETLLESAREELAENKPEQWKIFLLGAMAGLRRNEIDKLPWSCVPLERGRDPYSGHRILSPEIPRVGKRHPG